VNPLVNIQATKEGNREEEEEKGRESERLTPPGKDLFVIRLYFTFVLFPHFALPSNTFFL
jgi:hypothetical protein